MATRTLDPVTFEVLKNAFVTVVDEMAEQILRTCHSFVIFSRDFSCALHDARGDTIMQGSQDIAVHVGTLHFTCKDVMREHGDNRDVTIAFLHGFLLGKSGNGTFDIDALHKQTSDFIEYCLDNPSAKAVDAMSKIKG